MVTSQVSVELARACLGPFVVSVAAGEGVGDLVPGVLHGALGLLDAPFVLQVPVSAQRTGSMEFQEVMRERFAGVIEDATGRQVIGFMSGNQQHPDLMCEVFILGPTDLVDDHEIPAREPSPSHD